MTKGWSAARRRKQAENCRATQPWQNATGPKTAEGKAAIKSNALKHGLRSREGLELRALLQAHREIVNDILKNAPPLS